MLHLRQNGITHLRPDFLIVPHLKHLNLEGNALVSLDEVTQYSWGSSLAEHVYLEIILRQNPWHCNASLMWMFSNLYEFNNEIIYAKPERKPYIKNVQQLFCKNPDARRGTTVVPRDIIERVNMSIHSLDDLAGKCFLRFVNSMQSKILYLVNQWLQRYTISTNNYIRMNWYQPKQKESLCPHIQNIARKASKRLPMVASCGSVKGVADNAKCKDWGLFSVSVCCSEYSYYAYPITSQITKITCPVIGRAKPELTPSKAQRIG